MNIWEILGIEPTKSVRLIKKAFAEKINEVHEMIINRCFTTSQVE